MAKDLSTEQVIHDLERDFGFKIYKRGSKYSVWHGSHSFCCSDKKKDLYTARQVHGIYKTWSKRPKRGKDILKRLTQKVSRRIVRDAIHTEEFEKIPLNHLPWKDDPWNYD